MAVSSRTRRITLFSEFLLQCLDSQAHPSYNSKQSHRWGVQLCRHNLRLRTSWCRRSENNPYDKKCYQLSLIETENPSSFCRSSFSFSLLMTLEVISRVCPFKKCFPSATWKHMGWELKWKTDVLLTLLTWQRLRKWWVWYWSYIFNSKWKQTA